jgi:hypothetical protein
LGAAAIARLPQAAAGSRRQEQQAAKAASKQAATHLAAQQQQQQQQQQQHLSNAIEPRSIVSVASYTCSLQLCAMCNVRRSRSQHEASMDSP